ncbi:lipid II:glycine glycyltransferase FemX [Halobacillus faecis]
MKFHVYHTKDKEIWHNYLNKLQCKDIYFTPEYLEVCERNGEGKATLVIYEENGDVVYYPFLIRKLSNVPHLKEKINDLGELYDITTPYGYGGPISNVDGIVTNQPIFKNFSKRLRDFCRSNNIVTEFVRFHPLIKNHFIYPDAQPTEIRNTIHIDLTKDLDTIWSNYSKNNRNTIRKANKIGLQVIHKPLGDRNNFLKHYYATMDKNNAGNYYYFSEDYFEDHARLLGENAEILEVSFEEKIIFSGIFMSYGDFTHYHLAGSDQDYLKFYPNNFVLDYAIRWAKNNGRKHLHLGGGHKDNDNLYRFKKRFNKQGDSPFLVGKRVHSEEIYFKLNQNVSNMDNFFPLYRSPSFS